MHMDPKTAGVHGTGSVTVCNIWEVSGWQTPRASMSFWFPMVWRCLSKIRSWKMADNLVSTRTGHVDRRCKQWKISARWIATAITRQKLISFLVWRSQLPNNPPIQQGRDKPEHQHIPVLFILISLQEAIQWIDFSPNIIIKMRKSC